MKDKVVLVSGGTRGIGYQTAKKYLQEGNTVVISGRTVEDGEKAQRELSALGEVVYFPCDASKEDQCIQLVQETIRLFGRIDVLANVAGINGKRCDFVQNDNADTLATIENNFMSQVYMGNHVAQTMIERGEGGVIVNVCSLCGFIANTEAVGYHASKGAIRLATQVMARDLSPYGIRVVGVAPGWVRTGMLLADIEEHGKMLHMKNRVIEPEEIANAIYLLSLPEASAINGTTVMTDDGYCSFKY